MFNYGHAAGTPNGSEDYGKSVTSDGNGNLYVLCDFISFIDMDPSYYGQANFRTSTGTKDVILAKYNVTGQLVWSKQIGGKEEQTGMALDLDSSGNIYVLGNFKDTTDFDPSPAVAIQTTLGQSDIFVAKYDSSGNYIWAYRLGSSMNDQAYGIKVENNGTFYILGQTQGTIDMDPSLSTVNISGVGANLGFMSKYTSAGGLIFAKNVAAYPVSFDVDGTGNIYITGSFYGTTDMDPGPNVINKTSLGAADIFYLRYDAAGNYVSSFSIGSSVSEVGTSICLDRQGNICIAGKFNSTVDFNPGIGVSNLTATSAGFVAKYTNSGIFLWADAIDGTSTAEVSSVKTDTSDNIYLTGIFVGTADFDPGAGVYNIDACPSSYDVFIQKLTPTGGFSWAKAFYSNLISYAGPLAIDNMNNLLCTGTFYEDTANFDHPYGNYMVVSNYSYSFFVNKIHPNGTIINVLSADDSHGGPTSADYLKIDLQENLVVAGAFGGKVDFDFSSDSLYETSKNLNDIYFSKYKPNGQVKWVKALKSSGGSDAVQDMELDSLGYIYISGKFRDTIDMDPGVGVSLLAGYSAAADTYFLAKYDSSGNYQWAFRYYAISSARTISIDVNPAGEIIVLGFFAGTVDFDPSINISSLTANAGGSIFMAKYSTQGDFLWAKASQTSLQLQTIQNAQIQFDTNNGVYTAYTSNSTFDFDFSSSTAFNISPVPAGNIQNTCLAGYDPSGNFIWAKSIKGAANTLFDLEVWQDRIYISGNFISTVDFDMTNGVNNVTCNGTSDAYLAKYDLNGSLVSAKKYRRFI